MYQRCQIGWQQPWSPAFALGKEVTQLLSLHSSCLCYLSLPLKNGKRWPWRTVTEKSSHNRPSLRTNQLWLLTLNSDFLKGLSVTHYGCPFLSHFLDFLNKAQRKARKNGKEENAPEVESFVNFCRYMYYMCIDIDLFVHIFVCMHTSIKFYFKKWLVQ